jgi:F-type H+-transporting ATPase subunit b
MAQTNATYIETTGQAHPGEPRGAFPPFQKDTFASQIIWLAITFGLLYLLMSRLALPRIGSILEQRQGRIDGDLAEAQRLKDRSDEALAVYHKALADARNRAQTMANEERQREAAEAEARRKELDATLRARIAAAEAAIGERKTAAMASVGSIAAEAAAAIVERLIGRAPPAQDVAAAVADAIKH